MGVAQTVQKEELPKNLANLSNFSPGFINKLKEFITTYPGATDEEKTFMTSINKDYTERYQFIQHSLLKSTLLCSTAMALYMIKNRPARSEAFKILIVFPLITLATSYAVPFIDFHTSSSTYISRIQSSPVNLKFLPDNR